MNWKEYLKLLEEEKKPHKYGAEKTGVDGIMFDSKKEARRYAELKLLECAGEIGGLRIQPEYDLIVREVKIGKYRGDFSYIHTKTKEVVVEDVKGVRTPVYRLKKKLMNALFGIKIVEV